MNRRAYRPIDHDRSQQAVITNIRNVANTHVDRLDHDGARETLRQNNRFPARWTRPRGAAASVKAILRRSVYATAFTQDLP
jgi:hypothetical protein